MSGLLVADTVPLLAGANAPGDVISAISLYLQRVQNRSLHSLSIASNVTEMDWGKLWQQYARSLESAAGETVAIAYPGSLGDAIDDHSTMAGLCQDWRLSALLTLPVGPHTVSLAAAFSALASSAKTPLVGFVLTGELPAIKPQQNLSQPQDLVTLGQQIEAVVRVPVVGVISASARPSDTESERDLFEMATTFNWELLPW